jgi:putative flippase GtrA
MARGRDEERDRDALRGYFEFFRHLSLVSTAILVVVLVLYRDLYLDPALAILSLVAFGVAVLASFYGMFVAMNQDLSSEPPGGFPGSLLRRLLYVAVGALGGAVLCLILSVVIAIVI